MPDHLLKYLFPERKMLINSLVKWEGVHFSLRETKQRMFGKLLELGNWKPSPQDRQLGNQEPSGCRSRIKSSQRHWQTYFMEHRLFLLHLWIFPLEDIGCLQQPGIFTWNSAYCSILSGKIVPILVFPFQLLLKICKRGIRSQGVLVQTLCEGFFF